MNLNTWSESVKVNEESLFNFITTVNVLHVMMMVVVAEMAATLKALCCYYYYYYYYYFFFIQFSNVTFLF